LGALEFLTNGTEKKIDLKKIQRIGGTSAGAITATLLAVGFSIDEIKVTLKELDFSKFLDGENGHALLQLKSTFESNAVTFITQLSKTIGNVTKLPSIVDDLISNNGVLTGDFFRVLIEAKIKDKMKIDLATFKDLHEKIEKDPLFNGKDLFVVGLNLTKNKSEVFSYMNTPDLIISDAVRISMSIPLLYQPHKYYIRSSDGMSRQIKPEKSNQIYVDGGLLDNYPLWLFDNSKFIGQSTNANVNGHFFINNRTLGFRLVSLKTKQDYESSLNNTTEAVVGTDESNNNESINSIVSFLMNLNPIVPFLMNLGDTFLQSEENYHDRRLQDKKRTIYIDSVDVSMLDFNLSEEKMQSLIYSGYTAASNFTQSLKDSSQHFSLSAPLLGSLLKIYNGRIQLNNEFHFKKSRIDFNSAEIPQVIYEFYSKGSDQEIEFLKSLKFSFFSVNALGDNVFHIAAKLNDKKCLEKLCNSEISRKSLMKCDVKNNNGDFVFDLIKRVENEQDKIEIATLLYRNNFTNATNCPDKSSIIKMLST
jgi:NTE family protein